MIDVIINELSDLFAEIIKNWKVNTVYLILGTFISVYFSIVVKKPKLQIRVSQSGPEGHFIQVLNRTSFLGMRIVGETAQNVRANIKEIKQFSHNNALYWRNDNDGSKTDTKDIAANESGTILLLKVIKEKRNYCLVNIEGKPIREFSEPVTKFKIIFTDLLNREYRAEIKVLFDNSHLINPPSIKIECPKYFNLDHIITKIKGIWYMIKNILG